MSVPRLMSCPVSSARGTMPHIWVSDYVRLLAGADEVIE